MSCIIMSMTNGPIFARACIQGWDDEIVFMCIYVVK